MDDSLEKYVKQHKEDFDHLEPSQALWDKINVKSKKTRVISFNPASGSYSPMLASPKKDLTFSLHRKRAPRFLNSFWKIAACLLLVSTVYLLLERPSDDVTRQLSALSELSSVEEYYTLEIAGRKQVLQDKDKDLAKVVLTDLDALEQQYKLLKQQFNETSNSTMIQDAMIQNLRIRMELLNRQIQLINKLNKEAENDEKSI